MVSLSGVPVTSGLHRLKVWSAIDPKSTTDGLSYCREPPFVPWIPDGSVISPAVNDPRHTGGLIVQYRCGMDIQRPTTRAFGN
jgi:hypothetical protein